MAAKKKRLEQPDFAVSDAGKGLYIIRPRNEGLMDFLFGEYIDPTGQIPLESLPRFIVVDDAVAHKWIGKLLEDGCTVGFFKRTGG
jgi:hypothetical protein